MIGIPYALAEAGFGLGLLLLLLVAGLTDYSLRLMVRAAHLSGTTSYQVHTHQSGSLSPSLPIEPSLDVHSYSPLAPAGCA